LHFLTLLDPQEDGVRPPGEMDLELRPGVSELIFDPPGDGFGH
jgi:hypothetical protein